jgi:hypothetical protein
LKLELKGLTEVVHKRIVGLKYHGVGGKEKQLKAT